MGERLGEGCAGGVDRAPDGEGRLRLAAAGAANGDERAAALLEQRPGRAREPHVGEELQRKPVLPVGFAELAEIAALGGASIVNEDVEPAERAPRRVDELSRRAVLAQIERDHDGLAAPDADCVGNLIERALLATREHEVAAFCRERKRDAAADAAARPG